MNTGQHPDEIRRILKEQLNKDNIKLWLPPYFQDGTSTIPSDLIDRYSKQFFWPAEVVATILLELLNHSVERYKKLNEFKETGLALIHVKISGNLTSSENHRDITIDLTLTGYDLKKEIIEDFHLSQAAELKVIAGGKIIEDHITLNEQNLKHNSHIMVLIINNLQIPNEEAQLSKVAQIRNAAHLLSSRDRDLIDDNFYAVQITDQNGKELELQTSEKKALAFALALHDKAKAVMSRRELSEAMLLLLEADSEFVKCRSEVLDNVDNYAILCLDIVWCHLCLENIDALPDAISRLDKCETCFNKSYGQNLERLIALKGSAGQEKALLLRLFLLKGVLAYHQGKIEEAKHLLGKAEVELSHLRIDDTLLARMMDFGYSEQESRLALRASGGDISRAVEHVTRKREEKEQVRAEQKEKRRKKKLQKRFGNTNDGQPVNIESYNGLLQMGFGKGAAVEALKQCDNDLMSALDYLNSHPEIFDLPLPSKRSPSSAVDVQVTDEMLAMVTAMGFPPDVANVVLQYFKGDVERSVSELLQSNGKLTDEMMKFAHHAISSSAQLEAPSSSSAQQQNPGASTSTANDDDGNGGASSADDESPPRKTGLTAEQMQAISSLAEDIGGSEEQHLDITLDDEAHFIAKYKLLLNAD